MKNKIFHSVRMETIAYVIISIILSLITTAILSLAVFMAKDFIVEGGRTYSYIAAKYHDHLVVETMKSNDKSNNHDNFEDAKVVFTDSNNFNIFLICVAIISFVFFFMVYFLAFTRKITDYFNELNQGLLKVSQGNFDVVFEVRNENELSNVSGILNKTIGDIKTILTKERDEERSRKEFITSIAHDLRTPLTSIIGYLQLVMSKMDEMDTDKESQQKNAEYIKIAYDKALRLQALIEDLFSFAKTDSVEMKPHFNEIDMVKLVEQLLDECYPSIMEAGLEADFKTNADSIPVMVDGELMARAIANLLTNGVKYGRDGKKLIVELEKQNDSVKIRVTNYGRLIPSKDLKRIFEKFYRVEESRSAETGGTGLGLAITQNIISLHNGKIDVRSDLNGTVFEVTLPSGHETVNEYEI